MATTLVPYRAETFRTAAYAGSGTTPRTYTASLPTYGIYLVSVICWHGANANQAASINAIVTWFEWEATGATRNVQGKSNAIGTVALSTGGSSPTQITDITLGDPDTNGQFAVSVAFSGADINPRVIVKGVPLVHVNEFDL